MKHLLLGAGLALLPLSAAAQAVNISGGVAVEAAYDLTANSGTEAEYPLSFYMQAEKNGFFGQLWFGTLPATLAPDQVEIDIAVGYSKELASGLGVELAYWAYFLNETGYSTAEIIGTLSYGFTPKLSGSLEVGYDVEAEETYTELGLDFALTDKWSLQGVVAYETTFNKNYYELGVTYAITEEVAFNVLYEASDVAGVNDLLTFTMSYDF